MSNIIKTVTREIESTLIKDVIRTIGAASAASEASLLHTLDNPNPYSTSASDVFARAVGASESYSIAGAYQEDDAGGTSSGKAYIFNNATGALLHTLDNPNAFYTSASDSFGWSVAISESYAISGAHQERANDYQPFSGRAYIFNSSTGALLHSLDNPNPYGTSGYDNFGFSVGISDTHAIVSAYYEDEAGGSNSGKAYIYTSSTGALLHTLDNPNAYSTSGSDVFGSAVAISESYSIIGAFNEDDAGGANSGKAYIFSNSTGALLHTLDDPNAYSTSSYDYFGRAVAISESYSIVGAYGEDDAGGYSSGKAYIYSNSTGALLHTLDNPNVYGTSANDSFGWSVGITDTHAIVSAYSEDDVGVLSAGRAYVYDVSTGSLLNTLEDPNAYDTSAYDIFGYSVGISDTHAIVGAYGEDDASGTSSGKAYIYGF